MSQLPGLARAKASSHAVLTLIALKGYDDRKIEDRIAVMEASMSKWETIAESCPFDELVQSLISLNPKSLLKLMKFCLEGMKVAELRLFIVASTSFVETIDVLSQTPLDGTYDLMVDVLSEFGSTILPRIFEMKSDIFTNAALSAATMLLQVMKDGAILYSNKKRLFLHGAKSVLQAFGRWTRLKDELNGAIFHRVNAYVADMDKLFLLVLSESFFKSVSYMEELGRISAESIRRASSDTSVSIYIELFREIGATVTTTDSTSIAGHFLSMYASARADLDDNRVSSGRNGKPATAALAQQSIASISHDRLRAVLQMTLCLAATLVPLCDADGSSYGDNTDHRDVTTTRTMRNTPLVALNEVFRALSRHVSGALPNHELMGAFIKKLEQYATMSVTSLIGLTQEQAVVGEVQDVVREHLVTIHLLLDVDHRIIIRSEPLAILKTLTAIVRVHTVAQELGWTATLNTVSELTVRLVCIMGRLRRIHDLLRAMIDIARSYGDVPMRNLLEAPAVYTSIREAVATLPLPQLAMCWPAVLCCDEMLEDDVDSGAAQTMSLDVFESQGVLAGVLLSLRAFNHDIAPRFMEFLLKQSLGAFRASIPRANYDGAEECLFSEGIAPCVILLSTQVMGTAAKVLADSTFMDPWPGIVSTAKELIKEGCALMAGVSDKRSGPGTASARKRARRDECIQHKGEITSPQDIMAVAGMTFAGHALLFNAFASFPTSVEKSQLDDDSIYYTLQQLLSICSAGNLESKHTATKILMVSVPVWVGALRERTGVKSTELSDLSEALANLVITTFCTSDVFVESDDKASNSIDCFDSGAVVLLAHGMDDFVMQVVSGVITSFKDTDIRAVKGERQKRRVTGDELAQRSSSAIRCDARHFRAFFDALSPYVFRAVSIHVCPLLCNTLNAMLRAADVGTDPSSNSPLHSLTHEPTSIGYVASLLCRSFECGVAASLSYEEMDTIMMCLRGVTNMERKAHVADKSWVELLGGYLAHAGLLLAIANNDPPRALEMMELSKTSVCSQMGTMACVSASSRLKSSVSRVLARYVTNELTVNLKAKSSFQALPPSMFRRRAWLLTMFCDLRRSCDEPPPFPWTDLVTVPQIDRGAESFIQGSWWCLFRAHMRTLSTLGLSMRRVPLAQSKLVDTVLAKVVELAKHHDEVVPTDSPKAAFVDVDVLQGALRDFISLLSEEGVDRLVVGLGRWFDTYTSVYGLTLWYTVAFEVVKWASKLKRSDVLATVSTRLASIPTRVEHLLRVGALDVVSSFQALLDLMEITANVSMLLERVRDKTWWSTACLQILGQVAQFTTWTSDDDVKSDRSDRQSQEEIASARVLLCASCLTVIAHTVSCLHSLDVARTLGCLTSAIHVLLSTLTGCSDSSGATAVQAPLFSAYSKAAHVVGMIAHNHKTAKLSTTIMSSLIHSISDLQHTKGGKYVSEGLLPGILNVYNNLSPPERRQVHQSLSMEARATLQEVQGAWRSDYLFTGK